MSKCPRFENLEIRRLLAAAGDLDVGYGADAFAMVGGSQFIALAAAPEIMVQPDGKVVLLADYKPATAARLATARMDATGVLDPTWGGGGIVVTSVVRGAGGFPKALALQEDGKALVAVMINEPGGFAIPGPQIALQRFNSDGSIDETISGGSVRVGAAHMASRMYAGVRADGQIEVVGIVPQSENDLLVHARFDALGVPDETLGGAVTLQTYADGHVLDVAIQPDGKILVLVDGAGGDPVVVRLRTDGDPDSGAFSDDARVPLEALSTASDLALLPNGDILIAGAAGSGASQTTALMRINSDGSVDSSFSDDGLAIGPVGQITRYALTAGGEIRALGKNAAGETAVFGFTAAGAHDDAKFGGGGTPIAREFTAGFVPYAITLNDIAVDEFGHILLPGVVSTHASVDGGAGAVQGVGVMRLGRSGPIVRNNVTGHLFIDGTESADVMTTSTSGDALTVTLNGVTQSYSVADVTRLSVRLLGGDDECTAIAGIDTYADGGDDRDTVATGDGVDTLIGGGSSGDDLNAGGGKNEIIGSEGDDLITATGGAARITAMGGNDTILCGDGYDTVDAGAGNDSVSGGDGNDTVFGGSGADTILAGGDHDWVYGGDGNDSVLGCGGADMIFGGAGRDYLSGGGERDRILGGGGADRLRGGDKLDQLDGGNGDDLLLGSGGDDVLWGRNGNDTLNGEGGSDNLQAGRDDDLLIVLDDGAIDLLEGSSGTDTVQGDDDPLDVLLKIESDER